MQKFTIVKYDSRIFFLSLTQGKNVKLSFKFLPINRNIHRKHFWFSYQYNYKWRGWQSLNLSDLPDGREIRRKKTTCFWFTEKISGKQLTFILWKDKLSHFRYYVLPRIWWFIQKLEDALTNMKKLSSHRKTQLTKVTNEQVLGLPS